MLRRALATVIADSIVAQRGAADRVASLTQMATDGAFYGKMRPDFYRTKAGEAVDSIVGIAGALQQLLDLLALYRILYPAAHDDDLAKPTYCACGRVAAKCPARKACENGDTTWKDEAGISHDVSEASPPPGTVATTNPTSSSSPSGVSIRLGALSVTL